MKRYLISLILSLTALVVVVSPVLGIAYPDGQQHYYSVLFRGNGEAIVSFKAHFSNISDQSVNTITFQVPSGTISDISAYQLKSSNYNPPCYPDYQIETPQMTPMPEPSSSVAPMQGSKPVSGITVPGSAGIAAPVPVIMPCKYPDYRMPYNYGYGNQYEKAQVSISGQTITIVLPLAVPSGQDANYFLTYRTTGLVHKTLLGSFAYQFETLKTDSPVSDLQIGIATDDTYFLKDANGSINYNGSFAVKALPTIAADGVSNTALDNYYNQIGQGTIYKSAFHLSPNESYTVSGVYADSQWKLYGREISIGIAIVFLCILVVFFVARFIMRRLHVSNNEGKQAITHRLASQYIIFLAAGIGFISAVGIVLVTVCLYFLGIFFSSSIPYSAFQPVLFILVVLSAVGMYAILLFGPAAVIAMKKGLGWGIGTFMLTVLWVSVCTFVLFFVLFTSSRSDVIRPMPMYNSSSSTPAGGPMPEMAK